MVYMINTKNNTNDIRIEKIKVSMTLAGHSREHLSKLLGINRNTLTKKLAGKTPWTICEIEELARIYNKPRQHFF